MVKLGFEHDSWIQSVSYDTETLAMTIVMKGGSKNIYECNSIPRSVYDSFESASSKGTFFNQNIKGKYMSKIFT